jgi:hypothetical protein
MSALNGDKARFHRDRKQKIARRQRTRELLKGKATISKSADVSGRRQSKVVSA